MVTREDWLRERKKGIGGSDIGIILGVNKWKSLFELWVDKTGSDVVEQPSSEVIHFGNVLEEVVAKEFCERTGKKVRKSNKMHVHKDYPFLIANVDRLIVGEDAILECKTTSEYNKDEWSGDEIPASYIAQVQHYLNVLDKQKGYIAVLIGGNKFVWKEIERDQELIDIMQQKAVEFWTEYVVKNVPPEVDGTPSATKYIATAYADDYQENSIKLDDSIDDMILSLEDTKKQYKVLETEIKKAENLIKLKLGKEKAEIGLTNRFIVSWKTFTRSDIDKSVFKEKYPEIYKELTKESSYKRFSIKSISK